MMTVMSNKRSFIMAIPTKAPRAAVASECITGISQPLTIRVGRRNIASKIIEITKKLTRMYSIWRRARVEVSRLRARNRNQHASQIKTRRMKTKLMG